MNELTIQNSQLPTTIEDLTKFALLGPEKLKMIKAEINSLKKLKLAEDVYQQKLQEQRLLSNLMLDVYAKIGELTDAVPKLQGNRTDLTSFPHGKEVNNEKTKTEALRDLGFSNKQAHEFGVLAKNKDLIEQEKAEAAEEGRPASRTRVLDLAQQRKKREEEAQQKNGNYYAYLDFCKKVSDQFTIAIHKLDMLKIDDQHMLAWKELFLLMPQEVEGQLQEVERVIPKILKIQKFLKELKK